MRWSASESWAARRGMWPLFALASAVQCVAALANLVAGDAVAGGLGLVAGALFGIAAMGNARGWLPLRRRLPPALDREGELRRIEQALGQPLAASNPPGRHASRQGRADSARGAG